MWSDRGSGVYRRQYGLNPVGEAALIDLEAHGVSEEFLQQCRAAVRRQTDVVARHAQPSRAAYIAMNAVERPDPQLPPLDEWSLVLSHYHRTREGLDNSARVVLRVAAAQYAVLVARGRDTSHLLRHDGTNKVRPPTGALVQRQHRRGTLVAR